MRLALAVLVVATLVLVFGALVAVAVIRLRRRSFPVALDDGEATPQAAEPPQPLHRTIGIRPTEAASAPSPDARPPPDSVGSVIKIRPVARPGQDTIAPHVAVPITNEEWDPREQAAGPRARVLGMVDPVTGVEHHVGDRVEVCQKCGTVYTPAARELLRSGANRCISCDLSFRSRRSLFGIVGPDGYLAEEATQGPSTPRAAPLQRMHRMVDPVSGSEHEVGADVEVCQRCRTAYSVQTRELLRERDDRCVTCDLSFRSRRSVPGSIGHDGLLVARPDGKQRPAVTDAAPGGGPDDRFASPPSEAPPPRTDDTIVYEVGNRIAHDYYGPGRVARIDRRSDVESIIWCMFDGQPDELPIISRYGGMRIAT